MKFLKQKKVLICIGILGIVILSNQIKNSNKNYEIIETNQTITSGNTIEEKEKDKVIVVHVTGEVKKPGIVKVREGDRIEDVIEMAGGLTEQADISCVNLAYVVVDGMKIRIPAIEDEELSKEEIITEDAGKNIIISEKSLNSTNISININTATQTELEGLPGIGASIAGRIVEYRNQKGKFKTIEDIKNVTGIGENKFEQIKDFIKV